MHSKIKKARLGYKRTKVVNGICLKSVGYTELFESTKKTGSKSSEEFTQVLRLKACPFGEDIASSIVLTPL